MENKKKSPSWGVIIICFFVFWPVSIYLMYQRMANNRAAAMRNSRIFTAIGCFFLFGALVMAGVIVIVGSSGGDDIAVAIFGFLFYFLGGILIMNSARKLKKSGEQYKRYIDIVINQRQRAIQNVAFQMGEDYAQTVKGLQQMIDRGYFAGAFIVEEEGRIVFPNEAWHEGTEFDRMMYADGQKIVKCQNCGGNNVIAIGRICECDYCGSPMK